MSKIDTKIGRAFEGLDDASIQDARIKNATISGFEDTPEAAECARRMSQYARRVFYYQDEYWRKHPVRHIFYRIRRAIGGQDYSHRARTYALRKAKGE